MAVDNGHARGTSTTCNRTDRIARFEREAKTLAALNHPHIAHIHGFEQSGSTSALVMELVEGEDHLADDYIPDDDPRRGSRHGRIHVTGAGARTTRRSPHRCATGDDAGPVKCQR